MYMIEIKEEKMDGLVEHLGKAAKMLGKAMQCVEDIRKEGRMHERDGRDRDYDDYEDYDYEMNEQYGNRSGMRRGGGRYSRY